MSFFYPFGCLQEEYVQKANPAFAPTSHSDELKKEVPICFHLIYIYLYVHIFAGYIYLFFNTTSNDLFSCIINYRRACYSRNYVWSWMLFLTSTSHQNLYCFSILSKIVVTSDQWPDFRYCCVENSCFLNTVSGDRRHVYSGKCPGHCNGRGNNATIDNHVIKHHNLIGFETAYKLLPLCRLHLWQSQMQHCLLQRKSSQAKVTLRMSLNLQKKREREEEPTRKESLRVRKVINKVINKVIKKGKAVTPFLSISLKWVWWICENMNTTFWHAWYYYSWS